jgi:hypothetical protein
MPRKPKQEKQTVMVIVNGKLIAVILHPPTGTRKSWYAYWNGLVSSKSTEQRNLRDAIIAAENMVCNRRKPSQVSDDCIPKKRKRQTQVRSRRPGPRSLPGG